MTRNRNSIKGQRNNARQRFETKVEPKDGRIHVWVEVPTAERWARWCPCCNGMRVLDYKKHRWRNAGPGERSKIAAMLGSSANDYVMRARIRSQHQAPGGRLD